MNADHVSIWRICVDVSQHVFEGTTAPTPEYAHSVACLLFGTAAQESDGFRARRQYGHLPDGVGGYSLWQMERAAVQNGINQINDHPELWPRVQCPGWEKWFIYPLKNVLGFLQLKSFDPCACALARLYYWRCPEMIPPTIEEQAKLWKLRYNTYAGAGTVAQYMNHWNEYCAEIVANNP